VVQISNLVNLDSLYAEVFPIRIESLPKLYAYSIETKGDKSAIGGKLAYRLRREQSGHYAWTRNQIVTDRILEPERIDELLEKLWKEQPENFGDLVALHETAGWHPSPQSQADFVAQGLFLDIEPNIQQFLKTKNVDLGNATIERYLEKRGWEVQNSPAISISISSHLLYKKPLNEYVQAIDDLNRLEGIFVADRTSTLKGEIVEIVGKVADHRKRLLANTAREEMQEIIQNADENEIVVRIASGRKEYDYPISALKIVLRGGDYSRFNIDSRRALNALRIEPRHRSELVMAIADIVKSKGIISNAYNSKDSKELFSYKIYSERRIRYGNNSIVAYNERPVLEHLQKFGLYRIADRFKNNQEIKVQIIDAVPSVYKSRFYDSLKKELRSVGFSLEIQGIENLSDIARFELENTIDKIDTPDLDLILAFLPDDINYDEDELEPYYDFKSITVRRGIPSQAIFASTIDNKYALGNIVLGILGKTGNIPFVFAEPLSYSDMVVGIDIARQKKTRLPGSMSATAIARIYFGNGELLRYAIYDTPLEGETIPESVLRSLFPIKDFKEKNVVIHRDGHFRGKEKQALLEWAKKIGATFYLVEILKSGTPRLYGISQNRATSAPKGSAFILNPYEALVVSSSPQTPNATAQPLRIRSEPPFSIEQAIDSVLSLTLLHYGSLLPPRLPVTIHYSDKIAYFALRGIKPRDLEGQVPFWL